MTNAVDIAQTGTISSSWRNRIINGGMVVAQRGTASVTITDVGANTYTLDRFYAYGSVTSKFSVQQNAGSVTPPVGFINYLGATSLSAYSIAAGDQFIVGQNIEGLNIADLGWGTANAQTVTLSFWTRSSLTGTFGGALRNSADNRSYPFSYTISAANTWEQKTVTIAGDTSGTWLTTNGVGIKIFWGLGVGATFRGTAGSWSGSLFTSATGATSVVGTSGATFYVTGVQLEAGSAASPFEYRDYGRELIMCQRYFRKLGGAAGTQISGNGAIYMDGNNINFSYIADLSTMRTTPTPTLIGTANTDYGVFNSPYSFLSGFTVTISAYSNLIGFVVGVVKNGHGLSNTPTLFFGSNTTSGFVYLSSEL
jgi:hypothetical protein